MFRETNRYDERLILKAVYSIINTVCKSRLILTRYEIQTVRRAKIYDRTIIGLKYGM